MIKEALEYIVNLSAPHLEFRNGSHYADRVLHRIPNELTASPLAVHTLSAVRDYIESGADECAEDEDSIGRRFRYPCCGLRPRVPVPRAEQRQGA